MEKYDVVIIGGGPAGLTAAIYTARASLKTLIIEKDDVGSMLMAHKIDNYPGFEEGITGKDLYAKMKSQAKKYGTDFINASFLEIDVMSNPKIIKTDKRNFETQSAIIAMGKGAKTSSIKGEKEFIGKGVSYCATCDGAFYKNMTVAVFGNGDEAAEETLSLTPHASKILLFVNDDQLDCQDELKEQLNSEEKIEIHMNSELQEIKGSDLVEKAIVKKDNKIEEFETTAAFLFLGTKSNSDMFAMIADVDSKGFIGTAENMQTYIEGIYAAGDIRKKEIRQVTTATSDGTIAGMEATKFVIKNRKNS